MTTSCNVTVAVTLAYGRCRYKYFFFFFSYGKFVTVVFEGPASERDSFPKNYTLMLDLGAVACFLLFCLY